MRESILSICAHTRGRWEYFTKYASERATRALRILSTKRATYPCDSRRLWIYKREREREKFRGPPLGTTLSIFGRRASCANARRGERESRISAQIVVLACLVNELLVPLVSRRRRREAICWTRTAYIMRARAEIKRGSESRKSSPFSLLAWRRGV